MDSHGIRLKDLDGKYKYPVPYFPIGYIYLSTVEIDASTLNERYGGTWEQIKDMFLLCCGDKYSAGSTGGESEHVLTINEMPKHGHPENSGASSNTNRLVTTGTAGGRTSDNIHGNSEGSVMANQAAWKSSAIIVGTGRIGGDQAHNNMPPYLAVYAYQRIS